MRILLDLQACQASSMHRGIGRYSMALALAMARNIGGHDLRIVLNQDYPDSVATIRQAFDALLPQSHITTFVAPVPAGEVDPRNAWRIGAAERIREHYLASLRPDVVHIASLFEGLGDNVIASVPRAERPFDTAVTLYDLIPLMRKERYLSDPNVARWYYRKLEALKQAGLLLAISESARTEGIELLQLPPERVVNISSAVDTMFRPRTLSPEARAALLGRHGLTREFVMYTGGIDYRKNIEGLVEAYARLPAQLRRRHQLAVVCSIQDPDRFRLERLAAKCGLAKDELVLTGFVSDDDLVSLYNCTSLFVFPSLHEGFGLPALEAMACGVPVIGSNTSSIPEVIGRADALFDPSDIGAITASMAAVLGDPGRQAELRAHGLAQATRFSWDASARRAIEAFEQVQLRRAASGRTSVPAGGGAPVRKPRLAYVSPVPPTRSGIAAYSADLLPDLAQHFDIELVLAQDSVDDPVLGERFPQRSVEWFDANADSFDHIVYQFGNSAFHAHMFGLLERHPGVVVLHDFFLSGVINHAEPDHHLPNHYCRSLYLAHGYGALVAEKDEGRTASIMRYPCNKAVLDRATGVIVHSAHAVELANRWYGPGFADHWRVLPLVCQRPGAADDRAAARAELGFAGNDFVVCSFGILSAPKCNDKLVEAWLDSSLADDPRCHLVFVGEVAPGRFGMALRDRIAAHPRIKVTGYASTALYRRYLLAADAAVQLRGSSRGETSGSALDCLSYGLPTIVNAHGSAAELPEHACLRLEDAFSQEALRAAIERLHGDAALRAHLAQEASAYMERMHPPARAATLYREALEYFAREGAGAAERALLASIAALDADAPAPDLMQAAAAIAANRARRGLRQLLVDIGEPDAGAAPSNASKGDVISAVLAQAPAGWRVEPIRRDGERYRYARRLSLDAIGRDDLVIEDAVAAAWPGDVFLSFTASTCPPAWRARGVAPLHLDAPSALRDDTLAQHLSTLVPG